LVLGERHRQLRFVLRDRDAKFSRSFDGVFCAEGVEMLVTPVRAPNANAHAERWIRTVRAECLDWLLILGRSHLKQILRVYARHDNHHRPHRALGLQPPTPPPDWRSPAWTRRPESTDAISSVVSCTSTDKLHERLYAPYGARRRHSSPPSGGSWRELLVTSPTDFWHPSGHRRRTPARMRRRTSSSSMTFPAPARGDLIPSRGRAFSQPPADSMQQCPVHQRDLLGGTLHEYHPRAA
jgi:hypothetical protein